MRESLRDKFGRVVDYMRVAVTDRCNLRCNYCMPAKGIDFVSRKELCTYEELLRISGIVAKQGIKKLRITGGEPFLRKDVSYFIKSLSHISGIEKIAITTNGTQTLPYLDECIEAGVRQWNLSLDTLDPQRFLEITRRDCFEQVLECLHTMMDLNLDLKINAVVLNGKNNEDILPLVELGKENAIAVRFIEEMPFNGTGLEEMSPPWTYVDILHHIENHFGALEKLPDPINSTSLNYRVKGFSGTLGLIPAYSRTFCGSCNRIRLTPEGKLKTCLYDEGIFNLRDFMRNGAKDEEIAELIHSAVANKLKDGFAAERARKREPLIRESMSSIGG